MYINKPAGREKILSNDRNWTQGLLLSCTIYSPHSHICMHSAVHLPIIIILLYYMYLTCIQTMWVAICTIHSLFLIIIIASSAEVVWWKSLALVIAECVIYTIIHVWYKMLLRYSGICPGFEIFGYMDCRWRQNNWQCTLELEMSSKCVCGQRWSERLIF